MEFDRRRTLRLAGASLAGVLPAGCVSGPGPGSGTDGGDGTDGSDPTDAPDDGGPRVDEPPYQITEPECGEDDDRDPLWLCENMPAEPSVEFRQVETSSPTLADEGLRQVEQDGDDQYYATFFTEAGNLDRLHEEAAGDVVELIDGTDFATQAVLVAQSGWGSGSKTPHLKRIEDASEGVHAFGCSRKPCVWTDDHTVRTVVARFERSGDLEGSRVSLTVDPDTRVTVEVRDW